MIGALPLAAFVLAVLVVALVCYIEIATRRRRHRSRTERLRRRQASSSLQETGPRDLTIPDWAIR